MSNHLTLTGNIVRDPELRYSASGVARTVMAVATTRRFQAKGADQPTEVTSFFTVIVWGMLAEHVTESLVKGDRVTVSGRVEQRSWVDEDEQKRSSFDIVADDVAASMRFRTVRIDRTARSELQVPAAGATHEAPLESREFGATAEAPHVTEAFGDVLGDEFAAAS